MVVLVMIRVQRQGHLLEMILALGPAGHLTHFLNGRQEQRDQHRDDGDHDQ
jgi:hypothetical protein